MLWVVTEHNVRTDVPERNVWLEGKARGQMSLRFSTSTLPFMKKKELDLSILNTKGQQDKRKICCKSSI